VSLSFAKFAEIRIPKQQSSEYGRGSDIHRTHSKEVSVKSTKNIIRIFKITISQIFNAKQYTYFY